MGGFERRRYFCKYCGKASFDPEVIRRCEAQGESYAFEDSAIFYIQELDMMVRVQIKKRFVRTIKSEDGSFHQAYYKIRFPRNDKLGDWSSYVTIVSEKVLLGEDKSLENSEGRDHERSVPGAY